MKKKKARTTDFTARRNNDKNLIKALRMRGAPITSQVITSVARGIIEANDRSILIENGGYLTLNNQWCRNFLYRLEKYGRR